MKVCYSSKLNLLLLDYMFSLLDTQEPDDTDEVFIGDRVEEFAISLAELNSFSYTFR